ncbi:MAG: wax ester/triacylglycerol synthase family O-acyltransferase [Novosphingobium sp.]
MQQLSPQDAMFAYMERPNTPLQIGWLNIYDPSAAPEGKVRFKSILEHVEQRLHLVRFFRERLMFVPAHFDEPYWVDDEGFDLEYHIRHVALPAPGDWRQLCILVSRLFARPFDFNKPLWEFHVIEGLENVDGFPPGSFALLAKIHHSAADGVSGADVTTALHTLDEAAQAVAAPTWDPEKAPKPASLLLRAQVKRMRNPGSTIATIARSLPVLKKIKSSIDAGDLRKPVKHKVPQTRFSGPIGPHRVFDARRFQIEEMRPIRDLVPGATVNDVLLAISAGALRRYLLDKGELPEDMLVSTCPISIRSEEERGLLGNRIANMVIGLGTNIADPIERLRGIREETANAKGVNEAIGARTLTDLSELMPGRLVSLATRVSTRVGGGAVANTTVTNVPGPQQPLYFAGARLITQFGLGTLLEGMGIFHFVLSYCGEITLTVVADRDKLPDPAHYADCLQQAYDELRDAASATRS